jgi:MFS family permease
VTVPAAGEAVTVSGPAGTTRSLLGLLAADVVSTAGTEMTAVALPWFVLVSTGSPTKMGAVLAAEYGGLTLLGLFGGRVATVCGPRCLMLAADLARAALIAVIPLLFWLDALTFAVILAVAFAVGGFFPGYTTTQRLIMAGLVRDDELRLTRVSGLMGAFNETASFVGPALGGVLVTLIGAERVLVVDAVSYLSAFLLVVILVRPVGGAPVAAATSGVLDGLRYLFGQRSLRWQVTGVGMLGVGFAALIATLPVIALHDGGPTAAGWLLGSYGAGSVVGGLISSRARGTGGRTAAIAVAGLAVTTWLLLPPVPIWAVAGAVAVIGGCSGLYFPRFFAALTTRTPPALRARVMTSVTVAIAAPAPLGFLGAGLLAQHTDSTAPSLIAVAASTTLGAATIVLAGADHGAQRQAT